MITSFLAGLLSAWALAQVGLGVFFCLAFAFGRREREYLLFGLSTLALAVATSGTALEYAATTFAEWHWRAKVTFSGLVVAVPVHLHFLLYYARVRYIRQLCALAYLLAMPFAVLRMAGYWLVPGSEVVRVSRPLGVQIVYLDMQLRPHAMVFFVLTGVTLVVGTVLLYRVYRAGRREALLSTLGSVLLLVAVGNDLLLVSGAIRDSLYAWPHAFLIYAFAMASTLLYRYQSTAGELEQTALSLRERTAELRHSYRELSVLEDELIRQQQLAAVGQLAASIAHEVRNPLAVIVNATAGLRRSTLRQTDQDALLSMIDEEAARLNGLVTDLLRFARPVTVSWSKADLRELAQQAGEAIGDDYRVEVGTPDDPQLAIATVDPGLLRLALANVMENACQAMPQGGKIQVDFAAAELEGAQCVQLEVSDEGSGMAPEVAQRALEPFFTTRPSGTGLGLPIVQRIVEAHGGAVTLSSQENRGTTVRLCIPRHEALSGGEDRPSRRLQLRGRTP